MAHPNLLQLLRIPASILFLFSSLLVTQVQADLNIQQQHIQHQQAAAEEDFVCPDESPNSSYPFDDTCGQLYWVCADGTAYQLSCPGTSVFDPVQGFCTSYDQASCRDTDNTDTADPTTVEYTTQEWVNPTVTEPVTAGSSTSSTTPPTTPTTRTTTKAGGAFICPYDGIFPNPNDCKTFYLCDFGEPILQECPGNLVFNPNLNSCDYPINVPSCSSG